MEIIHSPQLIKINWTYYVIHVIHLNEKMSLWVEFHFLFPNIIQKTKKTKIAHLAIFVVAAYPDIGESNLFSFFISLGTSYLKFPSLNFLQKYLFNFRICISRTQKWRKGGK